MNISTKLVLVFCLILVGGVGYSQTAKAENRQILCHSNAYVCDVIPFLVSDVTIVKQPDAWWQSATSDDFSVFSAIYIHDSANFTSIPAAKEEYAQAITGRAAITNIHFEHCNGVPSNLQCIALTDALNWVLGDEHTGLLVATQVASGGNWVPSVAPYAGITYGATGGGWDLLRITDPGHATMQNSTDASLSNYYNSAHSWFSGIGGFTSVAELCNLNGSTYPGNCSGGTWTPAFLVATIGFSDQDGDGVPDGSDNCPTVSNPAQTDNNGNGVGDDCESAPTVIISPPSTVISSGNSVMFTTTVADSDNPLNSLAYEWRINGVIQPGANGATFTANFTQDAVVRITVRDPGNLSGFDEAAVLISVDSDGDGVGNNVDNCPNDANSDQADFDGDGDGDACDADDDNDGLSDTDEATAGTDLLDADTDDDTVGDSSDPCPLRGPIVAVAADATQLCPVGSVVQAAGAAAPIAVNLHGQSSFGVPVRFAANGPQISSVDFKLDYDETCIAFDETTDVNNDGLPDALLGLPASHVTSFQHNAAAGELTLIIAPPNSNPPLPLLADGDLVTVRFNVLPACVTNDGTTKTLSFGLSDQHYGNDEGQAVNGATLVEDYELRFNANPTDITLDNSSVDENASNATVGALDSADVDETAPRPGDSHTYSLVSSGCGTATNYAAGNGAFQISGATLKTRGSLDFEALPSHTVCLRTTDSYGGFYEEEFTISVNDLNEAPTSLALGNTSVNENAPVGTAVGNLSTTDEDLIDDGAPPAGSIVEAHSYSLPAGQLDNAQFQIVGKQLQTAAIFDHEVKNSYNVRIRTTDSAGQSFERVYTISILNVNDAPVANNDPASPPLIVVGDGNPVTIDVLANDTDQDNDGLSVSTIDSTGTLGGVTNNTTDISYTAPQDTNSADSFGYTVTDDSALGALTDSATVNLYVVTNDPRADCNSDGNINAADFPALVLEIFDTDVPNDTTWWRIFEEGFNGSPLGCDANASRNGPSNSKPSVNAADIICTVLVFFGNDACTGSSVQAASAADVATLSAPQNLAAAAGEQVSVELMLDTGGSTVSAATFALVLDTSKVSFAATDVDENGVPDAISFNVPASMTKSVSWNAELNRIEVALFGATLPLPTLSDGVLATVTLDVAAGATGDAPLTLELVSLGDDQGVDVEVSDVDGSLRIGGSAGIYLPIVKR